MKISQLAGDTRGPINKRYPAKTIKAYEKDLRELVGVIRNGVACPALPTLVEYFADELDMTIQAATIKRHLSILLKGGKLWQ